MSERWKLPFRRVARVQSQGAELVRCGTTARLVHSASASARPQTNAKAATASESRLRTAARCPPARGSRFALPICCTSSCEAKAGQ